MVFTCTVVTVCCVGAKRKSSQLYCLSHVAFYSAPCAWRKLRKHRSCIRAQTARPIVNELMEHTNHTTTRPKRHSAQVLVGALHCALLCAQCASRAFQVVSSSRSLIESLYTWKFHDETGYSWLCWPTQRHESSWPCLWVSVKAFRRAHTYTQAYTSFVRYIFWPVVASLQRLLHATDFI